jgi:hypothetical protein
MLLQSHVLVIGLQEPIKTPSRLAQPLDPPGQILITLGSELVYSAWGAGTFRIPRGDNKPSVFHVPEVPVDNAGVHGLFAEPQALKPLQEIVAVTVTSMEQQEKTGLDESTNPVCAPPHRPSSSPASPIRHGALQIRVVRNAAICSLHI